MNNDMNQFFGKFPKKRPKNAVNNTAVGVRASFEANHQHSKKGE
ncbi:MAG: hypothetical protein V4507_10760 [Verrucomicrobiota bacterium]